MKSRRRGTNAGRIQQSGPTYTGGTGMRGSRRGPSRWSSSLVSLAAAVGLTLATVPAHASPPTFDEFRQAPAPPADPSAMVAKVGPTVVDIDTQMNYQSAVGAGTGIVLSP